MNEMKKKVPIRWYIIYASLVAIITLLLVLYLAKYQHGTWVKIAGERGSQTRTIFVSNTIVILPYDNKVVYSRKKGTVIISGYKTRFECSYINWFMISGKYCYGEYYDSRPSEVMYFIYDLMEHIVVEYEDQKTFDNMLLKNGVARVPDKDIISIENLFFQPLEDINSQLEKYSLKVGHSSSAWRISIISK